LQSHFPRPMSHLIVLNLGKGNWQSGLPAVTAQLWDDDSPTPMQFTGSLPPAPHLDTLYRHWQALYEALYSNLGWRRSRSASLQFEIDDEDITHVSQAEFEAVGAELQTTLNAWLNSDPFRNIDRQLRTRLVPTAEIRLIIVADDPAVLRLPWSLWHFLEDYPQAEIALSPAEYARPVKLPHPKPNGKVRILAILGNSEGINVAQDQAILQQLPQAELKFLVEPKASELNQQLWEPGWDILFFAGHSSSQGKGHIQVNQHDRLTIDQLKYGLRTAIAHGLKLAIFNSCDGLGLARALADLSLPQVIVMREPVPDPVAQEFLKHFLTAFAGGKSLYKAVREAREKLQAIETEFPFATWLPVICQNPAELPPTWHEWAGYPKRRWRSPTRREWSAIALSSLVVTGVVTGIRWLGWLQPLELWAFDRLVQTRPTEPPDDRLLIVAVTDADIQAEGEQMRRGSISDRTLNQVLATLERANPAVIGLDIYRDTPATEPALAQRLQQSDRLFTICKRPEPDQATTAILPPPEVPEARVGFADLVVDPDGVIRRHLLFLPPNPTSRCTTRYALSVRVAARYLKANGLTASFDRHQNLQFGHAVFPQVQPRTSGYQPMGVSNGQILLNYRAVSAPDRIAQTVTVAQILRGELNPTAVKNRIVLIGIAAPLSGGDYWPTPYGRSRNEQVPGIVIHAHMISQILSTALNGRSLLWAWPFGVEVLWLGSWALVGSLIVWAFHPHRLRLFGGAIVAVCTLFGLCWLILVHGGWIPLLPAGLTLLVSSTTLWFILVSSDEYPLRHE